MKALVDQYLAERSARGELNGKSPTVIRYVLHGFADHVAHLELGEVSETDVEDWIADPDLRPATRRSMVTKLRPFVRWAVARGHLPRDFTVLVSVPKVPKGMPRFLEPEQVRALVGATRSVRDRLIVLLMVHLGLRRIEVSRIQMADLDMGERLLDVRGKNGRGEVTRTLPLPDEVAEAIDAHLAESLFSTGPLIRNSAGARLDERQIGRLVAELMAEVGIKERPYDGMSGHALRHTCAQVMVDEGVDVRIVQLALGHESMMTTEGYLRRKPKGLREAMGGRRYGDETV